MLIPKDGRLPHTSQTAAIRNTHLAHQGLPTLRTLLTIWPEDLAVKARQGPEWAGLPG